MRFSIAALAIPALVLSVAAGAQDHKKIQCWNDKDGHKMCGDRIPPEYAGQKRDVMQDGRVVDTVKAAKTPEEIAAEKRAAEEAAEKQRQASYDRDLLETYRSAKDLESMRDDRIALIDSRIASTKKQSEDTDRSLADLKARAEAQTKDGKPVDPKLAKQIRQFEKSHEQNVAALARAQAERAAVETKFNGDIARYNELRGVKKDPAKPADAAPAAPAAPANPPKRGIRG